MAENLTKTSRMRRPVAGATTALRTSSPARLRAVEPVAPKPADRPKPAPPKPAPPKPAAPPKPGAVAKPATLTESVTVRKSAVSGSSALAKPSVAPKGAAVKKNPAAAKSTAAKSPTAAKGMAAKSPTAAKGMAAKSPTAAKGMAAKSAAAASGNLSAKRILLAKPAAQRSAPVARGGGGASLIVRPDETPWTAVELADVRAELEAEVLRHEGEITEAERDLAELLRDSGEGAGEDQADSGTKTFEREHEMSLANNSRHMLLQSSRARSRMDDGTYGICETCSQPIGKARLQAFPRATLCMTCKQREERR